MYLIDTDIISQLTCRKPNSGVLTFFSTATKTDAPVFLSAITIGELYKGICKLANHGDKQQAETLGSWFDRVKSDYCDSILPFDQYAAEIWGEILARTDATNAVDKQIAAIGLLYDLTVVTRNTPHFEPTGAKCLNPFTSDFP